MSLTPQLFLTATVPIIVAVITGWFAYRQARRIAERNAASKSEELNLATFQGLNAALNVEISRLREDRHEDEMRHADEMRKVLHKLTEVQDRCSRQETHQRQLIAWARSVAEILRHPDVAAVLMERNIVVPDPPLE